VRVLHALLQVAGLNILTILAFSEGELEQGKALYPLLFAVLVPAVAYLLIWAWMRLKHWRGGQG
jgi:hypothetical protein